MNYEELGKLIYEVSLLRGNFQLRSGIRSTEYFDKYQFESRPWLLKEIANHMIKLFPVDFDILAGLETGGIPLATALSLETSKPVVFVRKKPKEYGTKKLAEGVEIYGKNIIVIEDVVTSGGQVAMSIEELRKLGAICKIALCVIDREQGGKENLQNLGIQLISLYTMSQLKIIALKDKKML